MRSRGPIRETSRGPVGQSGRAFHPSFVSKFARAAGTQYNERAGRKEGLVIVNGDIFVWECRLSSSFLYLFFHLSTLFHPPRHQPRLTLVAIPPPLPPLTLTLSLARSLCPIRCRVNFLPLLDPSARVSIEFLRPLLCSCRTVPPATTPSTLYFFPNFFVAPLSGPFVPRVFLFLPRSCARTPTRVSRKTTRGRAPRRPVFISIRGGGERVERRRGHFVALDALHDSFSILEY